MQGGRIGRGALGGLSLAAITALLAATAASAATYRPDTTRDHNPGPCTPRDCTLREAVIRANINPGRDTIVLEARERYNLTRAGDDSTATADDLDVGDDVVIRAAGRGRAVIDANGVGRVLDVGVVGPIDATLKKLTLTGGQADGFSAGGGLLVESGSTKLVRSAVIGNRSNDGGGVAVFNPGNTLRVVKSTVQGNRALTVGPFTGRGGGLYVNEATAIVRDSTFSDNTSTGDAGGLFSGSNALLAVTNSTVANNAANADGGGVYSVGETRLLAVTVARNLGGADAAETPDFGGGIILAGGTMDVTNSIVAQNDVGAGSFGPDCATASTLDITAGGVNLVGSTASCTGFTEPPDIIGENPRLANLAANGGPTKTLALRRGSPAINAAGPGSPARDQRGVQRRNPDIGAYERR